jgi:hypothetical protein
MASIFILKVKVQRSKGLNNLEIINEFLAQVANLHLPIFALSMAKNQSFFGFTYMSIVFLTVAINLFVILKSTSFLLANFFIMLYNNSNNLPLKIKCLIASNNFLF